MLLVPLIDDCHKCPFGAKWSDLSIIRVADMTLSLREGYLADSLVNECFENSVDLNLAADGTPKA